MQKWIEKVQEREIREDTDRSATSSSNVVVLIHFLTSEVVASVHDPTSQSNHIIRKKKHQCCGNLYCHLKKKYIKICLNNGGRNEFVFILAASNLTLVKSTFIKQIISVPAPAPHPQNNFGSTGTRFGSKTLIYIL